MSTYNITINKHSDFARSFQIKEDDVVLDLTNHSFAAQVRKHPTDSDATTFTVTVTDAAQGTLQIKLTDTQTAAMSAGTQYWDIVMTDDNNLKTRLLEGKAFVKDGVTR